MSAENKKDEPKSASPSKSFHSLPPPEETVTK